MLWPKASPLDLDFGLCAWAKLFKNALAQGFAFGLGLWTLCLGQAFQKCLAPYLHNPVKFLTSDFQIHNFLLTMFLLSVVFVSIVFKEAGKTLNFLYGTILPLWN